MSLPGQASGDFVAGSSALRILYVGHRNTFASKLTDDGFTQTNPPVVTANKSATLSATPKYGVLSASVALTRPDAGNGFIGGAIAAAPAEGNCRPLGLFINDAAGNPFENSPGPASGLGPYVSGQGTYGLAVYETKHLGTGADLEWKVGDRVYCSRNGYVTNLIDVANALEAAHIGAGEANLTLLGIVKIAPDSSHNEIIVDLRV